MALGISKCGDAFDRSQVAHPSRTPMVRSLEEIVEDPDNPPTLEEISVILSEPRWGESKWRDRFEVFKQHGYTHFDHDLGPGVHHPCSGRK